MPTIDDLRALSESRETYAGDPDVVRQSLAQPSPRTRFIGPALAATSVVAVAAVVAVLATGSTSAGKRAGSIASATGRAATQSMSGALATTAPPAQDTHLHWSFSVRALHGQTVTRQVYEPEQETAVVEPMGATIIVSRTGSIHPSGSVPVDPLTGKVGRTVSVNGRAGGFVVSDRLPYLFWRYAGTSWASVSGSNPADTEADLLSIAQAVTFAPAAEGTAQDVTAQDVTQPFRPGELPSNFTPEASFDRSPRHCVGYGNGSVAYTPANNLAGTIMEICREPASSVTGAGADTEARTVIRALDDGSDIVVRVDNRRLADVSLAEHRSIARRVDVTPTLSRPGTWLPVG